MKVIKEDFQKAASMRNMEVEIWFTEVSWRVAGCRRGKMGQSQKLRP